MPVLELYFMKRRMKRPAPMASAASSASGASGLVGSLPAPPPVRGREPGAAKLDPLSALAWLSRAAPAEL